MDSSDDDALLRKYLGDYPDGAYFAAESPPGADVRAQHITPQSSVYHSDGMTVEPRKMEEERAVFFVALDREEIHMLVLGLTDWGGPATMTDPHARRLGFVDADDVSQVGERIASRLVAAQSLSMRDWNLALKLTELAYEQQGDGWSTNQGGQPEDWLELLGQLRSKLPPVSASR